MIPNPSTVARVRRQIITEAWMLHAQGVSVQRIAWMLDVTEGWLRMYAGLYGR